MHRGASEAEAFSESGERGGGGVGGDAEDELIFLVDIGGEIDFTAEGIEPDFGEIEVAAACDFVGKQFATREIKFGDGCVVKSLVDGLVGVALDGKIGVFEKGEGLDIAGIFQVDEDANFFPGLWVEDSFEEASEVKWRKLWGCCDGCGLNICGHKWEFRLASLDNCLISTRTFD